jgi:chlorobactene glucosyltransferase
MILFWFITISLGIILVVSIYNLFTAPIIKSSQSDQKSNPYISVLIPARNEELNIGKCLDHLVKQDYSNIEILVLDDHSTDRTAQIVESYSQKNQNISLFKGDELPEGWLGKNWACYQLSKHAKGNYLLFIDADVELRTKAISSVLKDMTQSKVKLISIFSTQIIRSLGEWVIVPLMNWLLLAFLPLKLVYSNKSKSLVAANGQFMLWERKTYSDIGGHQIIKDKVVEDMEFARISKINNIRIKTMLGGKLIYCRMYNGLIEAVKGFSKNFFPGFDVNSFIFLLIITFSIVIFFLPFLLVFNQILFLIPIAFIFLIRVFISIISKQNLLINILLHPVQMIFMFLIGIKSLINSKFGKIEWKGRHY